MIAHEQEQRTPTPSRPFSGAASTEPRPSSSSGLVLKVSVGKGGQLSSARVKTETAPQAGATNIPEISTTKRISRVRKPKAVTPRTPYIDDHHAAAADEDIAGLTMIQRGPFQLPLTSI